MFSMNYQPPMLDEPIPTVWDLQGINAVISKGVVQSLQLTFYCYASIDAIGIKPPLDSKGYNVTSDQLAAFFADNNMIPGQLQQLGYGLAASIKDTGDASFFANASLV